jgi:hypothetical protein
MNVIVKYSPDQGPCLYDADTQRWLVDADGQRIVGDPATGMAKLHMVKCPMCLGRGRVPESVKAKK